MNRKTEILKRLIQEEVRRQTSGTKRISLTEAPRPGQPIPTKAVQDKINMIDAAFEEVLQGIQELSEQIATDFEWVTDAKEENSVAAWVDTFEFLRKSTNSQRGSVMRECKDLMSGSDSIYKAIKYK
jgi:hypothetical protein